MTGLVKAETPISYFNNGILSQAGGGIRPIPGRGEHDLLHKWEERIHSNIQGQNQDCTFS